MHKAIELGADAVEVDVHTCAEGIPVVIHHTVDKTTDGSSNVHTIPLADLKRLDAAAHRDGRPGTEPVPTLEEVVRETRGRTHLVLDIKEADIEGKVLEIIRMKRVLDEVTVWSTHPHVVAQFRE